MKRIFLFVLVLNIVFLIWNAFLRSAPPDLDARPEMPATPAAKPILLLSERPTSRPEIGSEVGAGEASAEQSEAAAVARASSATCYAVGPFQRNEDAAGAVMQLKERHMQARLRKTDERASTGFLVFVPPLQDRSEARRILREMHQLNIDSFIVTKGARTNAISVGLYTDRADAEARRDELKGKGFNVTIEERVSARTEFWVDVDGDAASSEAMSDIEKALGAQMAGMRLERIRCPQS